MPVMPGVIWKGDKSGKRRMDRYDVFCVHTIVGFAPAPAAHFSVYADGDIEQSRDTLYQSAANLNGNHRVISSENEDHGPRFGGTPSLPRWVPLTPEQVKSNGEILAWLHAEHGIPLRMNPDSKPSSRGLGYHRQGIDGNFEGYRFPGRVPGGELWTSHYGKVCPTDTRIAQLPDILEIAINGGDSMAQYEDILNEIKELGTQNLRELRAFRRAEGNKDKEIRRRLTALEREVRDDATRADIRKIIDLLPVGEEE